MSQFMFCVIEGACGVPSPHPSTPCQEQVEFTAEMVADRCETTAEKQALSEECCKHFCRELCLLLPLLLPLLAGTMQKAAKSHREIITKFGMFDDVPGF
mgnify:CR=1 FL=1